MRTSPNITVFCTAVTSDNKYIVSGGLDSTVKIWSFQDKSEKAVLRGHTGWVSSVQSPVITNILFLARETIL